MRRTIGLYEWHELVFHSSSSLGSSATATWRWWRKFTAASNQIQRNVTGGSESRRRVMPKDSSVVVPLVVPKQTMRT